jgi:hypothetical protein
MEYTNPDGTKEYLALPAIWSITHNIGFSGDTKHLAGIIEVWQFEVSKEDE